MRVENLTFGNVQCVYCPHSSAQRIVYLLYPMAVSQSWIVDAVREYGVAIVVVSGMDWDNDLTPWPARGVPAGEPDFRGLADGFLKKLTGEIVPAVEAEMGFVQAPERTLIGVSLSGLFALWQWARSDCFHNIAVLSGSFWYDNFVDWIERQRFDSRDGRCFMLLGDAESKSGNRVFASVEKCTLEIVDYLRRQGVDVEFCMVRGNHYQYAQERLERAMRYVCG